MSSQGARADSLIQSLDERTGSSAPPIAVEWRCPTCHQWHRHDGPGCETRPKVCTALMLWGNPVIEADMVLPGPIIAIRLDAWYEWYIRTFGEAP